MTKAEEYLKLIQETAGEAYSKPSDILTEWSTFRQTVGYIYKLAKLGLEGGDH